MKSLKRITICRVVLTPLVTLEALLTQAFASPFSHWDIAMKSGLAKPGRDSKIGCKRLSGQLPVSKYCWFAFAHGKLFDLSMTDFIKPLRKPISYAWSTETLSFSGTLLPLCENVHASASIRVIVGVHAGSPTVVLREYREITMREPKHFLSIWVIEFKSSGICRRSYRLVLWPT